MLHRPSKVQIRSLHIFTHYELLSTEPITLMVKPARVMGGSGMAMVEIEPGWTTDGTYERMTFLS